ERVKQEGKPGEKTTTTPITVNPITGEKVGEGDPTEEVTTEPVDKIVEFGGEIDDSDADATTTNDSNGNNHSDDYNNNQKDVEKLSYTVLESSKNVALFGTLFAGVG